MDNILRSHHIEPNLLRENEFDNYFKARENSLLLVIEQAMGKTMMREAKSQDGDLVDYEGDLVEENGS